MSEIVYGQKNCEKLRPILFHPNAKIIQRNKSPGIDGEWVQKSMIHRKLGTVSIY